jgi:RHS repeat-associated protein
MIWRVILFCWLGANLALASLPRPSLDATTSGLPLGNGANLFVPVARNAAGTMVFSTVDRQILPATVSPSYDADGNLTSDGYRAFGYDDADELTNVTVAGSWKSDFVYDALGRRRIERDYAWQGSWVLTNETHYVCDGMLVLQERNAANTVLVTYTRGLDLGGTRQGAGGIGGLLARTDASGSTYYHADAAGNITAMADASGNVVARYLYDPFGNLLGKWGALADANRYRFSSKEVHPNSGLYYYGFRFYEPNLQRWLNRDPIGERGGINLYGFVGNSPVNYVDPYGLSIGNYFGFTSAPSEANQAMQSLVQAHGYANMADYAQQNPSYNGWNPLDEVAPAASTAAAATDLYVNGAQAIVPAGIAGKGTEMAAQGIADAAEEGWLSKAWSKCFGKKTPRNSSLAGTTHPVTGIPFNANGFPDFSSVAKETVKIVYTGTREGDYEAANLAAGLQETPEGYTWHHVEDGTTMQLVPTDIHTATGHTGGFSMYPKQ